MSVIRSYSRAACGAEHQPGPALLPFAATTGQLTRQPPLMWRCMRLPPPRPDLPTCTQMPLQLPEVGWVDSTPLFNALPAMMPSILRLLEDALHVIKRISGEVRPGHALLGRQRRQRAGVMACVLPSRLCQLP